MKESLTEEEYNSNLEQPDIYSCKIVVKLIEACYCPMDMYGLLCSNENYIDCNITSPNIESDQEICKN